MTRRIHIDTKDDSPQLVPIARGTPPLRVVVVCPDPSRSRFEDINAHDLRIGVNRVASAVRCDYWVTLDIHTANIRTPRGKTVVVNNPNIHRQMCDEFPHVSRLTDSQDDGTEQLQLVDPRSRQ